jgi:hypothetical protein
MAITTTTPRTTTHQQALGASTVTMSSSTSGNPLSMAATANGTTSTSAVSHNNSQVGTQNNNSIDLLSTNDPRLQGIVTNPTFPVTFMTPPPSGTCCALGRCQRPSNHSQSTYYLSSHSCVGCEGDMHCELQCGAQWSNIPTKCGFHPDWRLVSADVCHRLDINTTDLDETKFTPTFSSRLLCFTCIGELQKVCPAIGGAAGSTSAMAGSGGGNSDTSAATGATGKADIRWEDIRWQDIQVSAGESNKVDNSKEPKMSKLMGVTVNGKLTPLHKITVLNLRDLTKRRIKESRKMKKKELADAIVKYKATMEVRAANGQGEVMVAGTNTPLTINYIRLINVIFGTEIKPQYAKRGAPLSKNELTEGKRMDQVLCENIITEYNNTSVEEYGTRLYDYTENTIDASKFDPIPATAWKKVQKGLKDLSSDYEHEFKKWTKSGTHCDFDDIGDIEPEGASEVVEYFHAFVSKNGDMMFVVLSRLHPNTFSESSRGAPGKGGGGKKGGGARGKKRNNANVFTEEAMESIRDKNHILGGKACVDMQATLYDNLTKAKEDQKKLISELADGCEGVSGKDKKKAAKVRVKKFKRHKAKENAPSDAAASSSAANSDSDDDELVESQESLIGEILETQENVANLTEQHKSVQKKVNSHTRH